MHPVNAALLYRQQLASQVNVAPHPSATAIDFRHYLTAQHATAQVISRSSIFALLNSQPVTIVPVLQIANGARRLLPGSVIGEGPTAVRIRQIPGRGLNA